MNILEPTGTQITPSHLPGLFVDTDQLRSGLNQYETAWAVPIGSSYREGTAWVTSAWICSSRHAFHSIVPGIILLRATRTLFIRDSPGYPGGEAHFHPHVSRWDIQYSDPQVPDGIPRSDHSFYRGAEPHQSRSPGDRNVVKNLL